MARSRVRGTNGKPRKKKSNRDSLRASVHIDSDRGKSVWKNDGIPTRRFTSGGTTIEERETLRGWANPISTYRQGNAKPYDGSELHKPLKSGSHKAAREAVNEYRKGSNKYRRVK